MLVLGCPKNEADAEAVAGILERGGFELVEWESPADVAILFTCAFLREAEDESVGAVVDLEELKRRGDFKVLAVVGCMPQRHRGEAGLEADLAGVDVWIGAADYPGLPSILDRALNGERSFKVSRRRGFLSGREPRVRLTEAPYSYLKISEGCRNMCSYCTIPSIRGDFRSRPMSHIVDEAAALADAGAREIILIGQDTALYGEDLYRKRKLGVLLKKLAKRMPEIWFRVMYCHPAHLELNVLETMAEYPNICPYVDLPIQHAADSVLKRMNRRVSKYRMKKLIDNIRNIVPGVVLRTTAMTGFPGETEAEFMELLDFVKDVRFERLGAFTYSPEEGTPAVSMPGQISERVKSERFDVLMDVQHEILLETQRRSMGSIVEVMVDGPCEDRPGWLSARSMAFAPEIDGMIMLPDGGYKKGERIKVKITEVTPYDLEAEAVEEN